MIDFVIDYFAEMTWLRLCVLIGTVTGLIVMILQIKQHIALWYFNIVSASLLGIDFIATEMYAYAAFQLYYIIVSIYGLYLWKKGRSENGSEMPIQRMKAKHWLTSFTFVVFVSAVVSFVLKKTGSEIAVPDAIITSLSAVATFRLTQKFLEYWYFWIAADSLYILLVLYIAKPDLYPTIILYACYVISAIIGIITWRKLYAKQQNMCD